MVALANVTLLDTFDTWRTRTNQIIIKLDQLETNAVNIVSNTSTITISGRGTIGNTVYVSSNALPNTGGTISGNLTIQGTAFVANISAANLTVTANVTVSNIYSPKIFTSNLQVSNVTAGNISVSNVTASNIVASNVIITGVLDLL